MTDKNKENIIPVKHEEKKDKKEEKSLPTAKEMRKFSLTYKDKWSILCENSEFKEFLMIDLEKCKKVADKILEKEDNE